MRQSSLVQGGDRIVDAARAIIENVIVREGQKVNAAGFDGSGRTRIAAIEDKIE